MSIRVGIDGRALGSGKYILTGTSGLGVYAINLIRAISEEAHDHEISVYMCSLRKNINDYPISPNGKLTGHVIRYPHGSLAGHLDGVKESIWMNMVLPHYLRKDNKQVIHILQDYMLPRKSSIKTVLTVHDLHTFYVPHDVYKQKLNLYRKSCHETDAIIAISKYTKDDLIERFNVPEEKIYVVHNGLTIGFGQRSTVADLDATRKKFKLDRPFIFTVGVVPRKNVTSSLKVFADFCKKTDRRFDFVLAGFLPGIEWVAKYRKLIDELNISDRIKILGPVSDIEIEVLMKMSTGLLFPSLCEGFGIPVIEAMAVGCPVVCSNTTSLPEIAGDAGMIFDPYDHEGMSDALVRIVEDDGFRMEIQRKGYLRAKVFSWKQAAIETLNVYGVVFGCTVK